MKNRITMPLQKLCYLLVLFVTHAHSNASGVSDISGVWKHSDKPVWLKFDLVAGKAVVREHQTHQNNAGLTVIKNINKVPKAKNVWVGEMYDGYNNKYVAVSIKLSEVWLLVHDSQDKQILKLHRE